MNEKDGNTVDPNIPRHIAIIMDGNGRWARERGLIRVNGHEKGADTVRDITRECARLGVNRLTLYAFSYENWKRPKTEINFLMRLLKKFLVQERKELLDNNIRFAAIGRLKELPEDIQEELARTIEISRDRTGMVLCLALSYGGRMEILDAVQSITRDVQAGKLDISALDEKTFSRYLYDPAMEEPDLLIRTGGDIRISNFLLWQVSYTEIWVTPVYWPEFTKEHLHQALQDFSKRERRFGGLSQP